MLCLHSVRKTKKIKSFIFSKILRPNIGLINPGPFSPEYNINIRLTISSHTSQGTSGPKSHHKEWTRMKHAQESVNDDILVLNSWRVVSVTSKIPSESVNKPSLLIHHSVNFTWVFYVVQAGKEGFEMLNCKRQLLMVQ